MKKRWKIVVGLILISALIVCPAFAADEAGSSGEEMPEAASASEGGQETAAGEQTKLEKANALLATKELDKLKQAISIYKEILKNDPQNFEATWRCAKAYREYGYKAKQKRVSGWEDICAEYGKIGMEYSQKAIELKPDEAQGYFFYGLNVGVYSDGVGIITALREGLKNKTQENLEKAYEIDKTFDNGGPMLALGRFWQKVPWPYNDKDKAIEYYRELQETKYFGHHVESYIYLAELLMDKWGKKPKREARSLLNEAIESTDNPYWQERARELLAEL